MESAVSNNIHMKAMEMETPLGAWGSLPHFTIHLYSRWEMSFMTSENFAYCLLEEKFVLMALNEEKTQESIPSRN